MAQRSRPESGSKSPYAAFSKPARINEERGCSNRVLSDGDADAVMDDLPVEQGAPASMAVWRRIRCPIAVTMCAWRWSKRTVFAVGAGGARGIVAVAADTQRVERFRRVSHVSVGACFPGVFRACGGVEFLGRQGLAAKPLTAITQNRCRGRRIGPENVRRPPHRRDCPLAERRSTASWSDCPPLSEIDPRTSIARGPHIGFARPWTTVRTQKRKSALQLRDPGAENKGD